MRTWWDVHCLCQALLCVSRTLFCVVHYCVCHVHCLCQALARRRTAGAFLTINERSQSWMAHTGHNHVCTDVLPCPSPVGWWWVLMYVCMVVVMMCATAEADNHVWKYAQANPYECVVLCKQMHMNVSCAQAADAMNEFVSSARGCIPLRKRGTWAKGRRARLVLHQRGWNCILLPKIDHLKAHPHYAVAPSLYVCMHVSVHVWKWDFPRFM